MPRPRQPASPFRYFKSSPEVIRLVVLMYVRFPLSLRNVEDLLFERGIDICHETVRMWWDGFGPLFAGEVRRKRVNHMRGCHHWRWHLDEMYVKLNGEMVYLCRAVDYEGEVLESYVTKTRDKAAALTFMKKALKRHGPAQTITTDGLQLPRRDERAWQRREAGGRPLGQQPGGELTPPVSTTREGDAPVQADEDAAEVRFRARQHQQPLQPGAPSHRPTDLPGTTLRSPCGVAGARRLVGHPQSPRCIWWRAVRVRLTAPQRATSPMRRLASVQPTTVGAYSTLWNNDAWGSGWVGETAVRPQASSASLAPINFASGEIWAWPGKVESSLEVKGELEDEAATVHEGI